MYDFGEHGYTVVKEVISKDLCDFITQYAFFDELQKPFVSDFQVPNALGRYCDPAMETVLIKIKKEVERVTGLSLLPTYSYYRVYGKNDELEKHTDRPSCEISASLCFNHSYGDDYEWHIYMNGNPISLKSGDMVVYKGMEIEHWREPLNYNDDDVWHLQGFLHYVDAMGKFSQHKYDGRLGAGMNKNMVFAKKIRPLYIR
jgi:hypothetical protein